MGKPDFSSRGAEGATAHIMIGNFLNAAISFLIVASVVYFAIVLPLNTLLAKLKKPAPAARAVHEDLP